MAANMDRDDIIHFYFEMGLIYRDIVRVLVLNHRIVISERQLKRVLKSRGLARRKSFDNIAEIIDFIQHQLDLSGQLHGYRWMYEKCNVNGIKCKKEDVRIILQVLNPGGTLLRMRHRLRRREYFSKGPNFIWHLDSYDKLRRFGMCINGCIDRFSRYVLWVNVYITSSDQEL